MPEDVSSSRPPAADADAGRRSETPEGTDAETELAGRLGDVARSLHAENDTSAMLDELVEAAVRLVPGAEDGSISLVEHRTTIMAAHPTSGFPADIDMIQTAAGEGPCLDAAYREQVVRVRDLRREERWPRFAPRAAQAGARSMLCLRLYVEDDDLGALNLYSRTPDAFDEESEQVGLVFASHAAVAFAGRRTQDELERAVDTRDLIGQAKGILMERFSIDEDQAFRVLVRASQGSHLKLREVAAELARSRRLPGLPDQPG